MSWMERKDLKDRMDSVELHSLEHLVSSRWSCRGYLEDPVDHQRIVRLLEIAQRAPSWCNTQPWQLIVTEGDGTARFRHALREYASRHYADIESDIPMPREYTGMSLARRRESGWQLYEAVGVARGDREASALQAMKNFELFGAPHVAIVTVDESLGAYGILDCGVYVANFLLAAQALGLAAIPQAALARYSPFVREYFNIPAGRAVLLGISFGLADHTHSANTYRTQRAALDEVVQWHSSAGTAR